MLSLFRDRQDAGRQLAEKLSGYSDENPVVLAIPRGGVAVGLEVARALGAPLDVIVARKLGAPENPEFGIGAISEDLTPIVNERFVSGLGVTPSELEEIAIHEAREVKHRIKSYRGDRPLHPFQGRTVLLIDDGLATGITAVAAARFLRKEGARRIILAAPVCAPETAKMLRSEADEVVCVEMPPNLGSIGAWYENFEQVSDDEVTALLAEAARSSSESRGHPETPVEIPEGPLRLEGDLTVPAGAIGLVLFAHGSGSSRQSPRNRQVARALNEARIATLLFDLLTPHESLDRGNVFDIPLLAGRLVTATRWVRLQPETERLPLAYFGASTGAAAALWAAAELGSSIASVVSRGGRPDLAEPHLPSVVSPTLLIVGGNDKDVLGLNRHARSLLKCPSELVVIPGATHLFEEPGALEEAARNATRWFEKHFRRESAAARRKIG